MSEYNAFQRLAEHAIETYGAIDTWVNNAGVAIAGKLEDLDEAEARRVFDINFWGMVHGCEAALPHLKAGGGVPPPRGQADRDAGR